MLEAPIYSGPRGLFHNGMCFKHCWLCDDSEQTAIVLNVLFLCCIFLCDFHRSNSDNDNGYLLLILYNVPGIGLHALLTLSPLNLRAWSWHLDYVTHGEKWGIEFLSSLPPCDRAKKGQQALYPDCLQDWTPTVPLYLLTQVIESRLF